MMTRFHGFLPLNLCGLPFAHVCSIAKMSFTIAGELAIQIGFDVPQPQVIVASEDSPTAVGRKQHSFIWIVCVGRNAVEDRNLKRPTRGGRRTSGTNSRIQFAVVFFDLFFVSDANVNRIAVCVECKTLERQLVSGDGSASCLGKGLGQGLMVE